MPRPRRPSTSAPSPPATATGSSRSTARVATLAMDVTRTAACGPATSSSSTPTTSASTSSCTTRSSASASSTPRCGAVVVTSAQGPRVLLGRQHLHARPVDATRWKVNFCKFTNETRNGIEDASAALGLKFLAAVNGTAPAAATSWRWPATRSCWSTTARPRCRLPEVPLLGVLPGTGGLTRVIDKRQVRRDLRRRLLHHRGRRARASARWSGAWSTRSCHARAVRRDGAGARRASSAARSDRPGGRARASR